MSYADDNVAWMASLVEDGRNAAGATDLNSAPHPRYQPVSHARPP